MARWVAPKGMDAASRLADTILYPAMPWKLNVIAYGSDGLVARVDGSAVAAIIEGKLSDGRWHLYELNPEITFHAWFMDGPLPFDDEDIEEDLGIHDSQGVARVMEGFLTD
ncbi:conserved protein of unknown function (plasmid) [Rhodovastum atsumiense]|uniref:Uncharacterized protein n=1 Tax=Rhodovastum atsumiense TaxID=504468 RepID=A0A5M6IWL7_9PROT|nr:hypothetical protein [Rhodovastum atsumiense]KAA5611858.1 hypothetical protein F1189_12555 [Rhodovastum atsumiense]CAH2606164.1 conserved protein of unknown function [Rhodovastum atsumiense]